MTSASDVIAALKSSRFLCVDEPELQLAVAAVLTANKIRFQPEVRLSARDRVDFMVDGGIALELKVATDSKSLLTQMLRYASHAQVCELIAASTTHHALNLPSTVLEKRLHAVQLMRW
jgi:hypothetical protein